MRKERISLLVLFLPFAKEVNICCLWLEKEFQYPLLSSHGKGGMTDSWGTKKDLFFVCC
ncbi:hypothetical protein SAMN05660649_02031 [Desulfotomaculum arcticum]|uniref:Uncharacterized protein n=1 Tax=Desulfotruncus arcticus DSM 17038 TaxID=1121424 RepID=A0A1I2T3P3_9FIRM|nr:hypothetical protein SAMN05660649_02031 [Desulfotomaculum arcticum] [Desulfotruncus arcticus DSM 17038]